MGAPRAAAPQSPPGTKERSPGRRDPRAAPRAPLTAVLSPPPSVPAPSSGLPETQPRTEGTERGTGPPRPGRNRRAGPPRGTYLLPGGPGHMDSWRGRGQRAGCGAGPPLAGGSRDSANAGARRRDSTHGVGPARGRQGSLADVSPPMSLPFTAATKPCREAHELPEREALPPLPVGGRRGLGRPPVQTSGSGTCQNQRHGRLGGLGFPRRVAPDPVASRGRRGACWLRSDRRRPGSRPNVAARDFSQVSPRFFL